MTPVNGLTEVPNEGTRGSLPHGFPVVVLVLSESKIEGVVGVEHASLEGVVLHGQLGKISKILLSTRRQVQRKH